MTAKLTEQQHVQAQTTYGTYISGQLSTPYASLHQGMASSSRTLQNVLSLWGMFKLIRSQPGLVVEHS